ncbi:hypothetical protein FOZ63_031432 [Perkinsus olseni]|uniref:Uncharacterized protein n=1 Tax=Perkinsus olseni TaxID=32597 RepID=A0A7J6QCZ4_PEROL|nr:hypothetical protein FOZ63_031432 [Perkinsus olseni]
MQFIRTASDQSKLAAMRRMREDESRTAMLKCLFIAIGIVFAVSMFLGTLLPFRDSIARNPWGEVPPAKPVVQVDVGEGTRCFSSSSRTALLSGHEEAPTKMSGSIYYTYKARTLLVVAAAAISITLWGCDLPDTGTCTQDIGHDRFISIKRQNDDPDHGPFELDSFSCGQGKAFTRVYLSRSQDLMQLFTPPEASGLTTCKAIFDAALAHAEDVRRRKQKKFWFDGSKKVTWEGVLNTLCITAEGTDDTAGVMVTLPITPAPMTVAAAGPYSAPVSGPMPYPSPSVESVSQCTTAELSLDIATAVVGCWLVFDTVDVILLAGVWGGGQLRP